MDWGPISAIVGVCVGAAVAIAKIFAGMLDTTLTREVTRIIESLAANEGNAKERHAMTILHLNDLAATNEKQGKKTRKKLAKVLKSCSGCASKPSEAIKPPTGGKKGRTGP